MARPKRGQLTQFMIPVRSSSDGSVASTVTESDFNSGAVVKFFGVNHGTSDAFTSGTVSKAARIVKSGVFQITLKATENNYDEMVLRINKTGLKETIAAWNNADYDDSDLMSRLSDIGSDLRSYLVGLSGTLSDVQSALSDFESNLLSRIPKEPAARSQLSDLHSDIRSAMVTMTSTLSDINSAVSAAHSDLKSAIGDVSVTITASDISDIASAVAAAIGSDVSDIYSLLSDLNSQFLSRVPKEPAARSQLSDLHSDLRSYLVGLSDQLSDAHSDLKSAIGDVSVTITASDISDIASAVVAALPISSQVSDIYSLLSDLNSQFLSRVPKEPAARSQLSDLHSDLRSVAILHSSTLSDVYSLLSDHVSNFNSRVTGTLATSSQVSDLGSDLRSYLAGISGALSDVESQLDATQALLSDFESNFGSRIPKEPAARSQLSDLHSDLRSVAVANSGAISDVYSLLSDLHSDVGDGVGLNASALSDIQSRVFAKTFTEPTEPPDFSDTFADWMAYWAAISINEINQTSSVRSIRNAADDGNIASMAVSDDGTTFVDGAAG